MRWPLYPRMTPGRLAMKTYSRETNGDPTSCQARRRCCTLLFRRSGKVPDTYDLRDTLLIVATDRISAFDSILPTGIPYKGEVLTALSAICFRLTAAVMPNHKLSTSPADYPFDSRSW